MIEMPSKLAQEINLFGGNERKEFFEVSLVSLALSSCAVRIDWHKNIQS
jgi:hypothetical protein